MKRFLIAFLSFYPLFTLQIQPVNGQENRTAYVRDMLYIVLRDDPENGDIIRSGIPSGMSMEILEVRGENSRVRLEDGYEGWVANQYLSDQPSARSELEALQAEMEAFEAERAELQATADVVRQLGEETGEADIFALQSEIASLRARAEQFDELNEERDRLLAEVQRLAADVAAREVEVATLESSARNAYFLRGAGAVLLGVLIALIVPALKPRKRNDWA